MDTLDSSKKDIFLQKSMHLYLSENIRFFTYNEVYQCLSMMWDIKSSTLLLLRNPLHSWSDYEGKCIGYHNCRPCFIFHLTSIWPLLKKWTFIESLS
jgi:hypothetical protein